MRLIYEHPWLFSFSIAAIGFGFLWFGLREGLMNRVKVGVVVLLLSVISLVLGMLVDTPTEHAKRTVYGLVEAVVKGDVVSALVYLTNDVILKDNWKGAVVRGAHVVGDSVAELHRRHTLSHNTVLKFVPIEREGDVLVELSLLTRVSGIGTVPSRWRLLVRPDEQDQWHIYSIDAIEIMGRSYR